uniref:Secreted Cereblon-like protein n=1 Tax=Pristhesancus plagipennis TaxID=1955184 RepID=A0A2K8JPA8_PRIPG|nr:secreted Cereblon-like protein [Pristhesancus plagipennis]
MTGIKIFILNVLVSCISLTYGAEKSSFRTDYLLCRHCGFNIASASSLINFKSPAADSVHNNTLFGLEHVEVQSIRNPIGLKFNVITAKGGTCVASSKKWQVENSWYPGYAWKACTCSRCSRHIGWVFEPLISADSERIYASVQGLYAFIVENVISEAYADSLLVTPKLSSYT